MYLFCCHSVNNHFDQPFLSLSSCTERGPNEPEQIQTKVKTGDNFIQWQNKSLHIPRKLLTGFTIKQKDQVSLMNVLINSSPSSDTYVRRQNDQVSLMNVLNTSSSSDTYVRRQKDQVSLMNVLNTSPSSDTYVRRQKDQVSLMNVLNASPSSDTYGADIGTKRSGEPYECS